MLPPAKRKPLRDRNHSATIFRSRLALVSASCFSRPCRFCRALDLDMAPDGPVNQSVTVSFGSNAVKHGYRMRWAGLH
jgi:hypothetical protein